MKNIYILLLIFLYIICNRCIENFSVGGSDINISGSLTLSYIDKCNPPDCPDNLFKATNKLESTKLTECDNVNGRVNCINSYLKYNTQAYPCQFVDNSKCQLLNNIDVREVCVDNNNIDQYCCRSIPSNLCPDGQKFSNGSCVYEYQCRCQESRDSSVTCSQESENSCNEEKTYEKCFNKTVDYRPGCNWYE